MISPITLAPRTKRKRMSRADLIFNLVIGTFCAMIACVIIYPLYFIIIASFSDPAAVALGQITLYPMGFTLEGYQRIFEYQPVWTGYRNTIFYTLVGTILSMCVTVPAAYALSRKDLLGRKIFNGLFIFTMFFSGGLIPTYLVIKQLGMLDTIWVMLLPGCISMYNCVIVRTYFVNSVPYDLSEAAFIDGCSNFKLFWRIIVPLSKPVLAVLALFCAVSHWNAYFNAMIYLNNAQLFPLQLVLRNILVMGQMLDIMGADPEMMRDMIRLQQLRESMKYGLIVVSTLPILFVYPFVQKYFVKGVMMGALKG